MYRLLSVSVLVLGLFLAYVPYGETVPGVPEVPISNPDQHARLAAAFIATNDGFVKDGTLVQGHHTVSPEQYPYVRFLSYWWTPQGNLQHERELLNCWINHMSFNQY